MTNFIRKKKEKSDHPGDKNFRVFIYLLAWIYGNLQQGKASSLDNRTVTSNKAVHIYHVWPDKLKNFWILLVP